MFTAILWVPASSTTVLLAEANPAAPLVNASLSPSNIEAEGVRNP